MYAPSRINERFVEQDIVMPVRKDSAHNGRPCSYLADYAARSLKEAGTAYQAPASKMWWIP